MNRRWSTRSSLVLISLAGCVLPDRNLGELATDGFGSGSSGGSSDASTSSAGPGASGSEAEGDGTESGEPATCEEQPEPSRCDEDIDRDGVRFACDNAVDVSNPGQADLDGDTIGDVIDLCPTVASDQNTADSDRDGIGNACDSCPSTMAHYNELADALGLTWNARVRNIPDVGDADGDGVGDACDNCVAVPNCQDYSNATPWAPGDPIDRDDPSCQRDDDDDMIGDACAGAMLAGAAGPVGFGPEDDFDQDGLVNAVDGCLRLPLTATTPCTSDDACGAGTRCVVEAGLCNHTDADGDGVGDICDTCAASPNPKQLDDGGAQEDDADADFVGRACEAVACEVRRDPAPMAFFTLAAAGRCCTTLLYEEAGDLFVRESGLQLFDPDGLPVRVECSEDGDPPICVRLPDVVAQTPGVLMLPPGCSTAGDPTGVDLGLDTMWATRCELPQLDQDFDGVGDAGDLCPFAFDPANLAYGDNDGMVWASDGRYCNGDYSPSVSCGA